MTGLLYSLCAVGLADYAAILVMAVFGVKTPDQCLFFGLAMGSFMTIFPLLCAVMLGVKVKQ